MKKNSLNLLLLAGGKGSRMSLTGEITPKPLLSTYDEPLLFRQIRQAQEVGIKQIIISTNPGNYNIFNRLIRQKNLDIQLIKNPEHEKGPLNALLYALEQIDAPEILVSLSDIFFLKNPFLNISHNTYSTAMGASLPFLEKDLAMGGIVFKNKKNNISKIVKKPLPNNKKGLRWNGMAYFPKKLQNELASFLKTVKKEVPLEYFFEYLRSEKEINIEELPCPDFINVNKAENLLIATAYRYSEVKNSQNIAIVADKLRKETYED